MADCRGGAKMLYHYGLMVNVFALVFRSIAARRPRPASDYPVDVVARDVAAEAVPAAAGVETFDTEEAARINQARLAHLETLGLLLAGKRVLDAGCGVGHHAEFYVERGCTVVCIDGRSENIAVLRSRHPGIEAHVANVERDDLGTYGRFDIIHCYGLLYHLENPAAALRNLAAVCNDAMIVETIVCDHALPVLRLADETKSSNQALSGLGCRPSPAFMAMVLNRIGFRFVYGAKHPPDHEDFHFNWRGNGDDRRDDRNLRCVFVASRRELETDSLLPLLRG